MLAILIANVTYLGFVTPPGGPNPYWQGCDYSLYAAFWFVNGAALIASVGAALVATLVPALISLPLKRGGKREFPEAGTVAVKSGFSLLGMSAVSFVVAFFLAGLVTSSFAAPDPNCGTVCCDQGGIACSLSLTDYYLLDLVFDNQTDYVDGAGNIISTTDTYISVNKVVHATFTMDAALTSSNGLDRSSSFDSECRMYMPNIAPYNNFSLLADPLAFFSYVQQAADYTLCGPVDYNWTAVESMYEKNETTLHQDCSTERAHGCFQLNASNGAVPTKPNCLAGFKCYSNLEYTCNQVPVGDNEFHNIYCTNKFLGKDCQGLSAVTPFGGLLTIATISGNGGRLWSSETQTFKQIVGVTWALMGCTVVMFGLIAWLCLWSMKWLTWIPKCLLPTVSLTPRLGGIIVATS